ncbi:MYB DNA-binding domain protein [Penicillium longicatenatum]|nr:MYB DNA-binding domain protein [Penicillium longicatenatum]
MARAGPVGPTPPRRVTRSQSQDPSYQKVSVKGARNFATRDGIVNGLNTVTEDTPISSRQRSISKNGSPEILGTPEPLEENGNISGTTFLEADDLDSDDDDEASDDPITMLDELPDLQQAASSLMNLLVSNQSDPIGIVNAAKRMRVAGLASKENKRLKSHCKKLIERMKLYGDLPFVDVPHIRSLIPSIAAGGDHQPWSPSPTLHSANCARLAIEVLLSTADSGSAKQVVESLNSQFPAPFLDQFVNGRDSNPIGSSAAEKAAWELALDIRTQYFIMEFEQLQTEKGFEPNHLLRSVFYDETRHEGGELDSRWLRGFSLEAAFRDENDCLPDRYHDSVLDRIGELELGLFDDDGAPNAKGLRAAFSWQRFSLRTARFLHTRDKEIRRDLKVQANFDDVHDLLERKIKGETTPDEEHTEQESSISNADESSLQISLLDDQSPVRVQSVRQMSPSAQQRSFATETTLSGSPEKSVGQPSPTRNQLIRQTSQSAQHRSFATEPTLSGSPQQSVGQPSPVSLGKQPAASHSNRRKSAKGQFLNMDSITRLKQRLSSVTSSSSRPEPRPAAPNSTRNEETTSDQHGDDYTNDSTNDFFDLSGNPDQSTTPPGSARTRQVSYNPSHQVDTPGPSRLRAPPLTSDEHENDKTTQKTGEGPSVQTPQRTIFDRQKSAMRVSPIDDEAESQSVEKRAAQTNALNSKKRPREETDDEESGDEFEQHARPIDVDAKRATKPQPKKRAPPREEHSTTLDSGSEANHQLQQQLMASSQDVPVSQSSPRQSTVSSSMPPPPRPTTTAMPRPASTSLAQPIVQSSWAARNVSGQTAPGKGGKWSQEEDDRLIQGMAVHGTSWATIIKEDSLCPESNGGPVFALRQRSQIDIKDRARVLKRRMQKAGQPLPPGLAKASKVSY